MLTQPTPIAFSGNIPVNYDSYLGPMFFEPFAIHMATRIGKLKPSSVLETAAGTGRLTKFLPGAALPGSSIIATDINPAMAEFGKQAPMNHDVKWMTADAVSLPFEDGQFDLVATQFGVMFFSDRVKAYREVRRVLQPGGTFIFTSWDALENNPMAGLAQETLKHFFPVDTPAFYAVPFSYFEEATIRRELMESGFTNLEIERVNLTGYNQSAAHAAKGLIEGTPTVTAIEERDGNKLPEIIKHLEEKIEGRFGRENLQVPLQALVITCTK